MKKTLIAISMGMGLMTAGAAMAANQPTVGFVNVQQVFQQSSLGQAQVDSDAKALQPQAEQLKAQIQGLQQQIAQYEQDQNKAEKDVAKGKTTKADAAVAAQGQAEQKARADLKTALTQYQALVQQIQADSQKDAQAFQAALSTASQQVAQQQGLQAVLPSEISLYSQLDVTDAVIAAMKSATPAPAAKTTATTTTTSSN